MRVAITGASGLIGTELRGFLGSRGHECMRLVRSREAARGEDAIFWKPSEGEIDLAGLEGTEAVVHLAGESLFGRWTQAKKERVWKSRIEGTRLISESIARMDQKPGVLVSSSGINYYGDTGDTVVDESSPRGSGFLAELCEAWEGATRPATEAGVRVVELRTAPVLSPKGGALKVMLPAFKAGVGGRLGSGDQWMSWISVDDMVGTIHHALSTYELQGPVIAASPNPVTNREFTETLGRVLSRPTVIPVPGFALKAVFGSDAADEMLLGGVRVDPARLRATGFEWAQPELEQALRHVLGK